MARRRARDLTVGAVFALALIIDRAIFFLATRDDMDRTERLLERDLPVDQVGLTADGTWMVYREGSQNGERAIRARRIGDEASNRLCLQTAAW